MNTKSSKLNIGYFADGEWAHESLNLFLKNPNLNVSFICPRYSFPDKYLEKVSIENGIDFIKDSNINNRQFIEKISSYACDLFVSMSFDQIFKRDILSLPNLGTINCHASKLPFYRGRNILNWVLINDEKEFGITVHYVDEGIDTGPIILQKTFTITDEDNYMTLLELSYKQCPLILNEAVKLILENRVQVTSQDDISIEGFYCQKRRPGDEVIDWDSNTRKLFNFIRAICTPGPCATSHVGNEIIKLKSANIEKLSGFTEYKVGDIVSVNKKFFIVRTIDGFLRVTDWESKVKLKVGDKLI